MPTLLEQAQPFGSIRGAGSGFGARIERIMEPNPFNLCLHPLIEIFLAKISIVR